jgi:hypothetical protein
MSFPAEPSLEWGDLSLAGTRRWSDVDAVATGWLGRPCVAVPSVRVGLCWALEFAGLKRHRSHVLVPRFVGRCILNSLARVALPVESPTADTHAAVVVDQYGLRQDLEALAPEFRRRGWVYVEDSPYGIGHDEAPGEGSLGRFIGLTKVLPIAQGALFLAGQPALAEHLARRREERSPWSIPVWLTIAGLRFRKQAAGYSPAADAAYEMYVPARGGNRWLRGNLRAVLESSAGYRAESARRLAAITERLHDAVIVPDLTRLGFAVPLRVGDQEPALVEIFSRLGFDPTVYHVDGARNLLMPRFERCLLLPLSPRIPRSAFDGLIRALSVRTGVAAVDGQ